MSNDKPTAFVIGECETATTKLLAFRNNGTELAHIDADGKLHITDESLLKMTRMFQEHGRFHAALEYIAKIGCMQSKDEEEFFCKHDGSAHSCYCPEGIARAALKGDE